MEKKNNPLPWLLLLLSLFCLIAGWLLLAPLLFFWLALLLKTYDLSKPQKITWWKLAGIVLAYMLAGTGIVKLIQAPFTIITVFQAVLLSGSFILYHFIDNSLPDRFPKFHLVLFWFAGQYICLSVFPSPALFFIADAPSMPVSWVTWNTKTGFLGGSLWIFITNLLIYKSFPARKPANWLFIALAALSAVAPVLISFRTSAAALKATDMLLLYQGGSAQNDYAKFGEVIARTAAWISILIIIFTLVKLKTQKA